MIFVPFIWFGVGLVGSFMNVTYCSITARWYVMPICFMCFLFLQQWVHYSANRDGSQFAASLNLKTKLPFYIGCTLDAWWKSKSTPRIGNAIVMWCFTRTTTKLNFANSPNPIWLLLAKQPLFFPARALFGVGHSLFLHLFMSFQRCRQILRRVQLWACRRRMSFSELLCLGFWLWGLFCSGKSPKLERSMHALFRCLRLTAQQILYSSHASCL